MHIAGQIIEGLLWFFIAMLWMRFVVDWVQIFARSWVPRGLLLVLLEIVYSVTDPPIKALRKVIPPLRLGNFALDLSFIIVMIVAYVLLYVNRVRLPEPERGSLAAKSLQSHTGAIVRNNALVNQQRIG